MSRVVLTPTRPTTNNERFDTNVNDDNNRRIPNRVAAGNAVVESQKEQNSFELSNGEYGGAQLQSKKGTVQGQGGSTFTKEHSIPTSAEYGVAGCVFSNVVNIAGKVVYNNCRFEKLITVQNGARAIFNGCIFVDSGQIDNSLNALVNVDAVGCMRIGTPAHINVTIVGEVVA